MVLKIGHFGNKSEIPESLKFGAAEGWRKVGQIV
jgi:hypothetical protein